MITFASTLDSSGLLDFVVGSNSVLFQLKPQKFQRKTSLSIQQCSESSLEVLVNQKSSKEHREYNLHCLALVVITEQCIKKKGAIFYRP